jgi:uncharacterized membrane protein
MAEPEHGWTDKQVEQVVGNLLRAGVMVAAAVVAVGGTLYLLGHGEEPAVHSVYNVPENPPGPVAILTDALQGDGAGVIELGLLLLIATPVARVVFSVFAFGVQRDYTYVGITLIVLAVLLYSLFFGHP